MAKKPTITTVSSGFLSRDQINTNFTNIRDAFDNTLSLDGSTPNTISANVDWNGYGILNVGSLSVVGSGTLDLTDFTAVAAISADVTTVAGIAADVTSVAADATDIGTVASLEADITSVVGISADISAVAADATDIGTVSASIANVNTVATNISGVNDFAARYRVAASAPATSLDEGDLYWNTTSDALNVYNGSAWEVVTTGALTALADDTTPSLGGNLAMNGNTIVDIALTGAIVEDVYALSGTSVALDPSNGTIQTHTLSGTTTYTDSLSTGESITLVIPGTANTITWPTIKWLGGSAPTLDASNDNIITVFKVGSTLYGSSLGVFS